MTPRRAILDETGLDLEDVYAGNRSWSDLREAAGVAGRARRAARGRRCAAASAGCCTSTTTANRSATDAGSLADAARRASR